MKVIAFAILLSGLFIDHCFADIAAKTINPDDSYEEGVKRKRLPKNPRNVENEEEQFVHKDDTFVG